MRCHNWSQADDALLLRMVSECKPLFLHFGKQGGSYSEQNAWDSVAGRMLPSVCVTGAACRRRFERIKKDHEISNWDSLAVQIAEYERGLSESIYDCVFAVSTKVDKLFDELKSLSIEVEGLKDLWR